VFPLFFSTFELSRALAGFGIQFLSQREAIDTEGPLGRSIIVIVSAMAELERCIII
jgi:DNA invertase Pin-like site-specific DNA recombinase